MSRAPSAAVIVEEVLATILSARRVRGVLADACEVADLSTVPDSPVSLRAFIEGPLFSTLSQELGFSSALDVSEQIRGALLLALRDDIRRESLEEDLLFEGEDDELSGVRSRFNTNAPPVLALSQASLVVFLLQDMLGETVRVIQLKSQGELENQLARLGAQPVLIIIDRRHPCAGPTTCPALRRATKSSTVVWWGAHEDELADVASQLVDGPRLVATAPEMELADLGLLCRRAIELM